MKISNQKSCRPLTIYQPYQRALAVNPASKEPGASKLKRGAAVRVHPMVGRRAAHSALLSNENDSSPVSTLIVDCKWSRILSRSPALTIHGRKMSDQKLTVITTISSEPPGLGLHATGYSPNRLNSSKLTRSNVNALKNPRCSPKRLLRNAAQWRGSRLQ
jgi:hypothetical protein